VADINVLVAAAITPRGFCGRLLEAAIDGRWQLVTSPMLLALLAELEEVLSRDKFRRWLSVDEAAQFVADIKVLADIVSDPPVGSSPGDRGSQRRVPGDLGSCR
jgi:predicted nucleic acid-binding protein